MTARILRNHDFGDEAAHEWQRLLEMCCASEPFAKAQRLSSDPNEALSFLLLHRSFPRSIRFCTHEVDRALPSAPMRSAPRFSRAISRAFRSVSAARR